MINLFKKLQKENLLRRDGRILDLGCGNGRISEPFFKHGYETVLVDKNSEILNEAENNFNKIKNSGFKIINSSIENFEFTDLYDGIILSNVLSFQKEKGGAQKIINSAFDSLNPGGFMYFTLFGVNDEWATKHAETMSFYTKDEALNIVGEKPYFISEDYGTGTTMKGSFKIWHVFHLLYIK